MKVKSLISFARLVDGEGVSHRKNGIYEMTDSDARFYISKGYVEEVVEEKPKSRKKKSETDK